MDISKKVLRTINKYKMIGKGDKIVLAVSGGPDSTAMLYIMNDLRDELGCSLYIAHLNHCLRGEESSADAEFVKEQAEKLHIPFTIEKIDVKSMITNKESLESGARRIRYDFYRKVMSETKADKVAQGHTADDQAETILMRLLRGSGTKGLSGIPPIRDGIYIRPLIEISRSEVVAYLQNIGVQPRWDSSNLSTEYERNRIRHELIPLIEKRFSPNIKAILQQTAEILRSEDDFLDTIAKSAM
ncbi:TPA: tRNA lysidine(34) synthetase TilS, partial [Candidatus Poribacteria bacterium]|nr:tRNA lysidine(34) synthetase TilS [Candidatus Poribacteria bacterium]